MQFKASLAAIAAIAPYLTLAAPANDATKPTTTLSSDPAAVTAARLVQYSGPAVAHPDVADAAHGQAVVVNHCSFPVYIYVCGQEPAACTGQSTIAPNGVFRETYVSTVEDGRSIKISPTTGIQAKPILQFEYTVASGNTEVYYDLSDINGTPFDPYGFTLAGPGVSKACHPPGGLGNCPWVYYPSGGGSVYAGSVSSNIQTTLCTG